MMRRARLSHEELMHRLIPVRYLDETGLALYRRLAASRTEAERLRAAADLLDRLCQLGYARLIGREVRDGRVRSTYRNLVSLDTLVLTAPVADAPDALLDSGEDTRAASPRDERRGEDERGTGGLAGAVPSSILTTIAASTRRVDLAGPLNYLCEFLEESLSGVRIRLRLSESLAASQASSLQDIDDVVAASDEDTVCPAELRRQVEGEAATLHVPDLAADTRFPGASRQDHRASRGSLIVAPLVAEAYVYGTLEVWSHAASAFSADDVATVSFVAEFAAGLIRRRLEIEELIFVDQTTEIHNRRYFDEQLTRELERSKRTGHPMALLIIDLDDFKRINDTYGHAAGDSVLRQVAHVLLENARQVDIVARYGGEEFAVILPRITRETALVVAERMRSSIAGHPFVTGVAAEPLRGLTVSVGGALYPLDAGSRSELMDRADRISLYDAKRSGKDRVVFWRDPGGDDAAHADAP